MSGQLIVSTSRGQLRPLAFLGIQPWTRFSQLQEMLGAEAGKDCALLFACPIKNEINGEIAWRTSLAGPKVALCDLPEKERESILAKTCQMGRKLETFSEKLSSLEIPTK